MTDCQIFTAFVAAERIWKEIEGLVDEFSSSVKEYSKENVTIQEKHGAILTTLTIPLMNQIVGAIAT